MFNKIFILMQRKMLLLPLMILCLSFQQGRAQDCPTGKPDTQHIDMSTLQMPKPARMIDEPVAEYNTVAGTLTITLDAVSYSEYTIILSSGYANVDYYPTSAVVVFPASALSETTYIYIDSDDCGTYEGVLDMNAIGSNTY